MHPTAYPVPSKKKNAQESGFKGKSKNSFGCQCTSKNVTDIFRIGGPVSSEFKFHYDSSGHPNTKYQGKDFYPETGSLFVNFITGF